MKELLPGVGKDSTTQKIRQLERQAGTLPVIFALFFTEGLKQIVLALPVVPFTPTGRVALAINSGKMFAAAFLIATLYVYADERKLYAEKAKEKAKQTAEDVKDRAKSEEGN